MINLTQTDLPDNLKAEIGKLKAMDFYPIGIAEVNGDIFICFDSEEEAKAAYKAMTRVINELPHDTFWYEKKEFVQILFEEERINKEEINVYWLETVRA